MEINQQKSCYLSHVTLCPSELQPQAAAEEPTYGVKNQTNENQIRFKVSQRVTFRLPEFIWNFYGAAAQMQLMTNIPMRLCDPVKLDQR